MRRSLLLIDGIGCTAGALLVLFWESLWTELLDMPSDWRLPFGIVLGVFGLLLIWFARAEVPSAGRMRVAAVLNFAWVIGCVAALRWLDTTSAQSTAIAIAVVDAIMGAMQWISANNGEQA